MFHTISPKCFEHKNSSFQLSEKIMSVLNVSLEQANVVASHLNMVNENYVEGEEMLYNLSAETLNYLHEQVQNIQ